MEEHFIKLGDTVEYQSRIYSPVGIVGVVTGFAKNDYVYVLCPSGHEWMLSPSNLKVIRIERID
jgi:hypothetical protein